MLTPCPHCDQQVVLDDEGLCPLCHGAIEVSDFARREADLGDDGSEAIGDEHIIEVEAPAAPPLEAANPAEDADAETNANEGPGDGLSPPQPLSEAPALVSEPQSAIPGALIAESLSKIPLRPGFWLSVALVLAIWLIQALGGFMAVAILLALEFARGTLPELLRNSRALQAHLLSEGGMSVLMLFATGSVLVLGMLLSLFYGRRLWDRLSLRPFTPFQFLLILLTVLPANLIAVQAAIAFAQSLPPSMQQSPDIQFGAMSWPVVLVAICVFPGIGEELLFRGIMGRGLTARYGATVGILLTSLLFGVAHLAPAHAFATFLLGIVLHLVFVSTRSLSAAMLLHALNNAAAMTLYYLQDSIHLPGYTHHDVSLFVPLPVLAACVLSLGAIGIAFYATRTRWLMADGSEWSPGYFSLERPPEELSPTAANQTAPLEVIALLIALYGTFILSLAWSAF